MTLLLISIFLICFAYLSYRKLILGLSLFFLLLPTYLIRFHIGPLPSTLLEGMFGVIFLVWLIHIYQHKIHIKEPAKKLLDHRSLLIATSLFLLGATISVFTSVDARAALGLWKAFYVEPVIFAFILYTTVKSKTDMQWLIGGILLCGLITSLLAIYQHFTGWMVPYSFWENRNTFRVTAWYGFPNAVGLFLGPLVPLALSVIASAVSHRTDARQSHSTQLILVIIAIFFLLTSPLAIIFAKSTGAIIGVTAGIGVLLLTYKKTRLPTLILGIVAIIGLFLLPANNPIRVELLAQDRSGQLRRDMWAETAQYLSEHPITGGGLASYHHVIRPYRIDKWIEVFHHPHNIFLTMWVNVGLIGLVGFIWIIVWFVRVCIFSLPTFLPSRQAGAKATAGKKAKDIGIIPFLLSAMAVFIVMGLVDSPYIKNDLAMMFWVLPVLLLAALKNSTRL